MDERTDGHYSTAQRVPAADHLERSDIGRVVLEGADIALTEAVGTSGQKGEAGQDSWEGVRGEVL